MSERRTSWKWIICGLLLCATMLNYMDRQTLAQLAGTIRREFSLEASHYGRMEFGFGIAFALGGLFFGYLADRLSVRWLYPFVLLGWSMAGMLTAYASEIGTALVGWLPISQGGLSDESFHAYVGFLACRVILGFFEAGHWPCALVTTQRILSREDRSLGNSILQSGAAVGAIVTPLLVFGLTSNISEFFAPTAASVALAPGAWKPPFIIIGLVGLAWIVPWLMLIRDRDFHQAEEISTTESSAAPPAGWTGTIAKRILALIAVVITINMTWQYFRAWLPMYLEETHEYSRGRVAIFISCYYIFADLGCIAIGTAVKKLTNLGWKVHSARMATFGLCVVLVLLSVLVPALPGGLPLEALFMVVAAGSLGLFPNYYAFTQELSKNHQGKVTGFLTLTTWTATSFMQEFVGQNITASKSYALGIILAGVVPLFGFAAMAILWGKDEDHQRTTIEHAEKVIAGPPKTPRQ